MKLQQMGVFKNLFIIFCSVIVMIKGVHDENNLECTKPIRECLRKKYVWVMEN